MRKKFLFTGNGNHYRKLQLNRVQTVNEWWGSQLQWIHAYHSSCIYSSENISEETEENCKTQNITKSSLKLSLLKMSA